MSSGRPGFATHLLRYSTGNVLVAVAGLVSFPFLTRLLDNAQYGILNYYDSWVLMAVAIGKLGAQHAVLRFYPHGGDPERLRVFASSLFYLPLAASLALWIVVGGALVVTDLATGQHQPAMFWMALAATPLLVFASLTETVLRATENSRMVVGTRIAQRWLELVAMVGAVVWLQQSAVAAYGGKLLVAVVLVLVYVHWVRRHLPFARAGVDRATVREGLAYGAPLVATEVVGVAFVLLDRVMIKAIVGDFAAVGVYSIGAALAMQVNFFTNLTLFEAFTPAANRLYATGGEAAVRAFKARILPPLVYALVGIALLLACFGSDMVIALSGSTKAASGPVFAWIGATYALLPVLMVAGYGLLLEKRTTRVLALATGSLALNTALNLLLIPRLGLMGAVYATVASSAAYVVAVCCCVPRGLRQMPDLRTVATALGVALACAMGVAAATGAGLAAGWPRLLLGGGATGIAYAGLVLALDRRPLAMVREWLQARGVAHAPPVTG